MTIEFHFYRLHQETPIILQVWYYLGHSWLAHQVDNLYSYPQHYYIYRLSMFVYSLCILQTQCFFLCYLWQRLGVCVKLFLFFKILIWTYSFTSLQVITLKVMDKLNVQIRPSNNISMYIVIASKTTSLNSYLLQSLLTTMLQVLLPVFLCSLLIRDIIWTSLFTLNAILLSPKSTTLL